MRTHESAWLQSTTGQTLCLDGVRVEGTLDGALFEASVIQRFHNPHRTHVEIVYTFPLPWAAILLGVDVQLGERHLRGGVIEKRQAEAEYEEALADGNAAIMLEQNRDGSFTLNLGNLAPDERCIVRLRYAQVLQFEQHGLRLVVPTVIAPRYGNPMIDGGLRPHQVPEHDLTVEYPFELSLRLVGGLAGAHVASPSHPVGVRLAPEGDAMEVGLSRTGALDRDFVLVVSELAHDSLAVCGRDFVEPEAVTALVSFCPRIPRESRGLAVKVLVDCSGSMQGDSIAAARRALSAIVGEFAADDRFSLSRFGSTVEHRSRGLWRTTEPVRVAAQRWASGLVADLGGTEMEAALLSTFALAGSTEPEVPVDVLLVTDGEINAIERTVETAQASGHRVFAVGIGSSPAEGLLRRLAEVTGGASDFVAPGEAVEPAVRRMFARLRSPRVSGLELQWPEGTSPRWASAPGTSVFDGDTVTVFASFSPAPDGEVRLFGRPSGAAEARLVGRAHLRDLQPGDAVSRLAAAARVATLAKNRRTAAQAEALRLALAYQLVTTRTNFLLVEERAQADKPADLPELVKVQSMMPAGWGGIGSVLSSRAGATVCSEARGGSAYDMPAVMRLASRRAPDDSGLGSYDVPAFLRKQYDGVRRLAGEPDAADHWSQSEHYSGLTPLGLCEWLRLNPEACWPATYASLRGIGLGQAVVDWLELVLGPLADEQEVVSAFLSLMAQPEIGAALAKSQGAMARIRANVRCLTSRPRSGKPARIVPEQFATQLVALLADLRPHDWPACVFALEAPAVEHDCRQ